MDLQLLATQTFYLADVTAATAVPKERFQQWVRLGTVAFLRQRHPGTGRHRTFRLVDVYQVRLLMALTERFGLAVSDAAEIVNAALYFPGSDDIMHDASGWSPHAWPDAYRERDAAKPHYLVAHRSAARVWLTRFIHGDIAIDDVFKVFVERPDESVPTVAAFLNVTAELIEVDRLLALRLQRLPTSKRRPR